MKRKLVAALITVTAIGLSGCGKQTLALVSDKVEVELGSELDTNVASYVELDQKEAAEVAVDFSTVDVMKVGTYTASILYNEESIPFEVVVKDTTAPVVEVKDEVILTAGETLYAEDVITRVNELSGGVTVAFKEEDASTEAVDGTEMIDVTETIDASTEAVDATEDVAQGENAAPETSFVVGDVTCTNAEMTYPVIGEYDTVMIVADASGNSADVPVHVVVGTAPVFNGIEDIAVTTGTEEVNYLEGVSATDCNGNDLTDKIACDSSAVDLNTAGTYEITYTVTDEDGFQRTAKAAVTVSEGKAGTTKKDTTSKSSDSKKNTATSSDSKKTESASTGKTGGNSNTGNNNGGSNNNSGNGGNSGSGSQTTPDKGSNSNGGGSNNSGNGGNSSAGGQTTPDKGSSDSNSGGNSNGGGQTPTPTPAPTPTPTPDPTPAPTPNPTPDPGNNDMQVPDGWDDVPVWDGSQNEKDNIDSGDGHWETW